MRLSCEHAFVWASLYLYVWMCTGVHTQIRFQTILYYLMKVGKAKSVKREGVCIKKDARRTLNYCFSLFERHIITQPYHSNDTIWALVSRQLL